MAKDLREIKVGQRVHCILYGGKDGTVYAIEGEQAPATVGQMGGGVVCFGGRAYFNIVWDNGTESRMVPEAIIRGVQWRIYDDIATEDTIQRMLGIAEQAEAQRQRQAEEKAAADEAERKRLPGVYPYLENQKYSSRSPWALGAKNIRTELKRAFPGVKFSVQSKSYSGGCSINVTWTDGPDQKAVEEIADKYQYGSFNGMEDLYEYADEVWTDVFGGAKYVFCDRRMA